MYFSPTHCSLHLYSHHFTHTNSIRNAYRGRIISPDESDAAQIRTPKVTSFLRDVALRDLAVHATHAACVDGRGDVYQWGDGFFAQESASASGDRKPVLTLRGKVRVPIPAPLHVAELSYVARRTSRRCRSRNPAYSRFRLLARCMSYRHRQILRHARALLRHGGAR